LQRSTALCSLCCGTCLRSLLHLKLLLGPGLPRCCELHLLLACLHNLPCVLPTEVGLHTRLKGFCNPCPWRTKSTENVLVRICDHERHDKYLSLCNAAEQITTGASQIARKLIAPLLQGFVSG
jgi:hypothetical protein